MRHTIPALLLLSTIACKGHEPATTGVRHGPATRRTRTQQRNVILQHRNAEDLLDELAAEFARIGVTAEKEAGSNAIVLRGTQSQLVQAAARIGQRDHHD